MNVPRNSTTRGRRATVSVSAAVVSASLLLGACGVSNKSDTESVSARSAGTESPERERSNTTVAPTTEATTATAPEGASSGATMLKDAIRATAEATSFQAKASLALNGLPDGDATILSVDGGYDTQAKRGQFLIEVGQLPAMSGTVAEIPTPSGPVEVVVDGSTVYVRADELAALNNGKPWTSIDLSDLGGLAGATPPPAGADIPDQVLGALEGAFGNVEGEDVVGVAHAVATQERRGDLAPRGAARGGAREVGHCRGSGAQVDLVAAWLDFTGLGVEGHHHLDGVLS